MLTVEKDDGLPGKLCLMCTNRLRIAYDFRYQATYAEEYFRKHLPRLERADTMHQNLRTEKAIETEGSAAKLIKNIQEIDQLVTNKNVTVLELDVQSKEKSRPNYPGWKCDFRENNSDGDVSSSSGTCSKKRNTTQESELPEKSLGNPEDTSNKSNASHSNNDLGAQRSSVTAIEFLNTMFVHNSEGTGDRIGEIVRKVTKPGKKGKAKENKTKIECNICGSKFTQVGSLKHHLMKHLGQKPFKCEFCAKCFTRKTVLTIHRRLHTGDRPYQCDDCVKSFITKDALNRHKNRGHDNDASARSSTAKTVFECSVCHITKNCKYSLDSHIRKYHSEEATKLCDTDMQQSPGDKSTFAFKCPTCQRLFPKKYQLLYHLQTHENAEELIQKYIKLSPLSSVEGGNTNSGSQPNVQVQGNTQGVQLRRSKRVFDHGQKPTGNGLTEDVHLESDGSRECSTVSEKIKGELNEASDCDTLLGDVTPTGIVAANFDYPVRRENLKAMKRKYICVLCKKMFTHCSSLKAHMRKHSGDRPFGCEHCGKSFSRLSVLTIHRRLHTGERPYKCRLCENAFITNHQLLRHAAFHEHEDMDERNFAKKTKPEKPNFSQSTKTSKHEEPSWSQSTKASKPEEPNFSQSTKTSKHEEPSCSQSTKASKPEEPNFSQSTKTSKPEEPNFSQNTKMSKPENPSCSQSTKTSKPEKQSCFQSTKTSKHEEPTCSQSTKTSKPEEPNFSQSTKTSKPEKPSCSQSTKTSKPEKPSCSQSTKTSKPEEPNFSQNNKTSKPEKPSFSQSTKTSKPEKPSCSQSTKMSKSEKPCCSQSTKTSKPEKPSCSQSTNKQEDIIPSLRKAEKSLFMCNKCQKGFSSFSEYADHLDRHEVKQAFTCDVLDEKFEQESKLVFHMQQHKEASRSCKRCNEVFTVKDDLIRHVKTQHLIIQSLDYKCWDCGKGFYDTRDMKEHLLKVHGITTGLLNTCDKCQADFSSCSQYYEHIYEAHDEVIKTCLECKREFKSRRVYDNHFFGHYM